MFISIDVRIHFFCLDLKARTSISLGLEIAIEHLDCIVVFQIGMETHDRGSVLLYG